MSSTTYKVCSQCGAQMERRENIMTTSHPAQYIYDCPRCGSIEYDSILYPCDLEELATQSKNEVDLCDKTDRYEEALEKARVIYKGRKAMHYTDEVSDLEFLFPELAETYDEMMIEAIIDALNSHCNSINHLSARGYQMEDVEAWLEKRKISTEGDFGRGYDSGYQAGYAVAKNEMQPKVATATLDSEKQKDASEAIEAVERIESYITEHTANSWEMDDSNPDKKYYCGIDDTLANIAGILQGVYAKQKEQKPCLTCDEYDKGYKQGYTEGCTAGYNKAMKEQKPAEPSDEELVRHPPIAYTYPSDASRDEQLKRALIALLNSDLIKVAGNKFTKQDFIDWVERQKAQKPADYEHQMWVNGQANYDAGIKRVLDNPEKYGLCKPAEWSEEDEKMIQSIVLELQGLIECSPNPPGFEIRVRKEQNWLKSLHPQKLDASKLENFDPVDVLNEIKTKWPMAWEKVVGKQEWSKEDEEMLNILINRLHTVQLLTRTDSTSINFSFFKEIGWLKSLRDRAIWRPSKEQMEALKKVAYNLVGTGTETDLYLVQLYGELKILMEE